MPGQRVLLPVHMPPLPRLHLLGEVMSDVAAVMMVQ
jgi:hypothetical protein